MSARAPLLRLAALSGVSVRDALVEMTPGEILQMFRLAHPE